MRSHPKNDIYSCQMRLLGGSPYMYFLGKWKYVPCKTRVYFHYAYCVLTMSYCHEHHTAMHCDTLHVCYRWVVEHLTQTRQHSTQLLATDRVTVISVWPQSSVSSIQVQCQARRWLHPARRPGQSHHQCSPTQHWRIKVSAKFPRIFHNIGRRILCTTDFFLLKVY